MAARLRILQSKTIYDGKLVKLRVDRIVEPGGVIATREVVGHPGSVVVLPRLADGRVILVRQYRYAARRSLWELVAGGLEPGETPRQAARREMIEETGYHARQLRLLFDFYPSPGILSERMFLVEATGLTRGQAQPESDERLEVGYFTLAQLRRMLRAKKIKDAKTLAGLSWLLLFAAR
ncbi:MAG: NUDIX hydrolase [Terriglobia bacterium]